MSKIAFVTDSETCIPTNLMQDYNIHEVPNYILWSGKDYRIGLDIITVDVLYRLDTESDFPTTVAAPAQHYYELFTRLLAQGYDVLTVVQSKSISRAYNAALEAANTINADNLVVIDGKTMGMALGFALLLGARAAQQGADVTECADLIREALPNTGIINTCDDLKHLQRAGRISGAERYIGGLLRLKPFLEYRDGQFVPAGAIRTRSKALAKLITMLEKRIAGRTPIKVALMHSGADRDANQLAERLKDKFDLKEIFVVKASAAHAVYFGRGAISVHYMAGIR